jgi:hypothetical protein
MRTNAKHTLALRLNLSTEEYKAFRHYLVEHELSATAFMSGHIRRVIARESRVPGNQEEVRAEGEVAE